MQKTIYAMSKKFINHKAPSDVDAKQENLAHEVENSPGFEVPIR